LGAELRDCSLLGFGGEFEAISGHAIPMTAEKYFTSASKIILQIHLAFKYHSGNILLISVE